MLEIIVAKKVAVEETQNYRRQQLKRKNSQNVKIKSLLAYPYPSHETLAN